MRNRNVVFQMPVLFRLRKAILILAEIGLLVMALPCFALPPSDGSVLLAWNPDTSTNIIGYNIYYGSASGIYNNIDFVAGSTATNLTVINLDEGTTYYFAATSVNSIGDESPFSNETTYSIPVIVTNARPTLDVLNNLVVIENAPAQSVALTGISSGATNEIQTLTVTASSSNKALIPDPTVVYTSPDASGSLTFAPVANTFGATTISVSVNDGGTSNNIITRAFTVTVPAPDVTRPTLSIVSPALNQQLTTPTFTLTGKAADNVALANVFYSLNSRPWISATTANAWTNWTGSLALIPGTNTLQAYAVDTSGNRSFTNSVSFEFVVMMPVTVQLYGQGVPNPKSGSLSPNYTNGTMLAINEFYSLTAIPAAGFAFTSWSGSVTTNKATLLFKMQTNLTLNANFIDGAPPTLSIVSPALNQQLTTPTFTLTGKAADNVALANVFYSLNSRPWISATTANAWTNWTGSLALIPGTNTLQAYAVDTSGNRSFTNSVSFEYVVLMPVTVQLYGQGVPNPKSGSLSPNYTNGTMLAINEFYSLTAIPAAGFAFTSWSGSVTTNKATLLFKMQTNLTLNANFIDGTAPTLVIASPKLNQQLKTTTFTVTGKAADNVAVANVFYSLNSRPWTNAITANAWTNWNSSLALTPGTNIFQAYAVDTSGNRSFTNSVSFEYVVLMPVTAQAYGLGVPNPKWGSFAPKYSSQTRLPVNEKTKVTAKPAHGFAFTNWTDGTGKFLTNGPTLQFIMTTNLSLHANFVDILKPTSTIVSPKARQKFTTGSLTVVGKAADNVAVQTVYCSLNASPWSAVIPTNSRWSATLTLSPGTNVLHAFAIDTSGNCSTTNSVAFDYQPTTKSSASQPDFQAEPALLTALPAPADGQFALSLAGTEGLTYVLQVSSDLVNWSSVATNQSPFTFVDPQAPFFHQRFYRALSPP